MSRPLLVLLFDNLVALMVTLPVLLVLSLDIPGPRLDTALVELLVALFKAAAWLHVNEVAPPDVDVVTL